MQIIQIFTFVLLIVYTTYTSVNFVRATSSDNPSSVCDPSVRSNPKNCSSPCCKPNTVFIYKCNACNCSKDGTYANCSTDPCTSPSEANCDPDCGTGGNTTYTDTNPNTSNDMIGDKCYDPATNTTALCCRRNSIYRNALADWNTCYCNGQGDAAWCKDLPRPDKNQTLQQKII